MEGVEPEGGEEEVEAAIVVVPAGRDLLFFLLVWPAMQAQCQDPGDKLPTVTIFSFQTVAA